MPGSYTLGRVDTAQPLKDKAYAAIKDAILTVRLEPGMPLVESDLAQQLGISKTPIRDALQELEREGFVSRALYKGAQVTDVTVKDIVEVFQLRAVLEGFAARLVAPLFLDDELDRISGILSSAEAALEVGDRRLCSAEGRKLHFAIIDKAEADNLRLASIIRNLDDHVLRFRILSDRISGRLDKSVVEHRRVLDALYRRDPLAAEQAMRNHLFSVQHDLSASGEPPDGG
jgi:DNA-binding GntR family transcriptional regulator